MLPTDLPTSDMDRGLEMLEIIIMIMMMVGGSLNIVHPGDNCRDASVFRLFEIHSPALNKGTFTALGGQKLC